MTGWKEIARPQSSGSKLSGRQKSSLPPPSARTATRLILQHPRDHPAQRTTPGLYPIARLERGALRKSLDDFDHRLPIKHTGDIMRDRGGQLLEAHGGQFSKEQRGQRARNIRKGVAFEEQKRRPPVIRAQLFERFR